MARKTPTPKQESPEERDLVTVSVRLDREEVEALDHLRAGKMQTRSALIREIIDAHLAKCPK